MQLANVLYFLFLAGLFFAMMRFGCGAHIMGHGHRHHEARPDDGHSPGTDSRWTTSGTAIDPVCGMSVQTAAAKSTIYNGVAYYFCSQNCREKFEAAPATYAKPTVPVPQEKEKHHGY